MNLLPIGNIRMIFCWSRHPVDSPPNLPKDKGLPLKHAPHTVKDIACDWTRPYTREQAAFPVTAAYENKFWPTVNRIDDVYGDRNLICSCPAIEEYED